MKGETNEKKVFACDRFSNLISS